MLLSFVPDISRNKTYFLHRVMSMLGSIPESYRWPQLGPIYRTTCSCLAFRLTWQAGSRSRVLLSAEVDEVEALDVKWRVSARTLLEVPLVVIVVVVIVHR